MAWLLFVVVISTGNAASCASQELHLPEYYDDDFFRPDNYPFSFSYGGQSSVLLLSEVTPTVKTYQTDNNVQQIEKVWRCKDGLVVSLSVKYYKDYSAAEWITYLTYEGVGNSKMISDFYGIDNQFRIDETCDLIIHTNKGDDCTKYSYEPYDLVLEKGQTEEFYPQPESGKSTTGPRGWPYWNIQNGKYGWFFAVGWPGDWQNEISRVNDVSIRIKSGQKCFKAYLKHGETVRTPLICVLPWKAKDVATAQNIWRRFYIDHIIPRFNGEPEKPALEIQTAQFESSKEYVQQYIDAGIKPRICWTDAGWYPTNTGDWMETGEWKLDPKKYPNGISPFSTWAHHQGMESLLWFEPERVLGDNMLSKHHKDWLLPVRGRKTNTLNLGNPECLIWLINHIDGIIKENGLDWYREDLNNNGPYKAWVQADAKQGKYRQGITENLYVQGHLKYWDALKERNPNLHMDACASGGRRNDLETMHRAVPLLRSDYQLPNMGEDYVRGNQAHTWALSAWFPFQGSASYKYTPYVYRSFYLPCFGMGWMTERNSEVIIRAFSECKIIQPMMLYGDYWPLTPYSLEDDDWIAWQFNREKDADGCVQAFRREKCDRKQMKVRLRGLAPKAYYLVSNFDNKKTEKISGKKLMEAGYTIRINEKPGSAILVYEMIKK